jgi:tetratricopeptide (TPR) repeat protein
LAESLSKSPRIATCAPDLGSDALERALAEDVDDGRLPLDERLQSLLLTAGMDQSHRRLPLALEKYQLLFQHYSNTGNLALAAVALNGMGEVHRDQGNEGEAGACFEAAVVAASDGPQPATPILLNVFLNLGNLRMQQQRWSEAEAYYDCSQKLATVLRYVDIKLMVLEQLGLAQSNQGKVPEALTTWKAGAVVSRKLGRAELEGKHRERLRAHFASVGDAAGMRQFEQELGVA